MAPQDPAQTRKVVEALGALELPPPASNLIVTFIGLVDAGPDAIQHFKAMRAEGGAKFRAATMQHFATLADPNQRGEHSAAAAGLARRFDLLWSRGYFSLTQEADQEGISPGALRLLAEGATPAAALQGLLCALLALWLAADAAASGPAGKLRPTASQAAAHGALAWIECNEVQDLPPAVWEAGGVLEVLAAEIDAFVHSSDLSPSAGLVGQGRQLINLATMFHVSLADCQHHEALQAVWRFLLPAFMGAGVLTGMQPACDAPSEEVWRFWEQFVCALVPVFRMIEASQLEPNVDRPHITEMLMLLDRPTAYRGLAVLLYQLVHACARMPQPEAPTARQDEQTGLRLPSWWLPLNEKLTELLTLTVSLVGKREYQVETFLTAGGMAAIHEYLEFWGPTVGRLHSCHPRIHHHAGLLLELAADCMAGSTEGDEAQALFGSYGLKLCIVALDNMVAPDLMVLDPEPDRWNACKSLLRVVECACLITSNFNEYNCLQFVEEGGVEIVVAAVMPSRPPPSESAARQNLHWRITSVMRNGISLLASLVNAAYNAELSDEEQLGEPYLQSLVDALDTGFDIHNCTLASGLTRVVQWGVVASICDRPLSERNGEQAPSAHSLLSGALTLLCCVVERNNTAMVHIVSSQASLAVLQRAGQQYLVRGPSDHVEGACRAWLETLGALVRRSPSCEEELLSKGLLKTAGGVLGLIVTYMKAVHKAPSNREHPELLARVHGWSEDKSAQMVQMARQTVLEMQAKAVASAGDIVHTLTTQGTPSSARCCEALLDAAGSIIEPDSEDLPAALHTLWLRVLAARDMIARQRSLESAALEQKMKEAEAAFAELMAEEEQAEQKQAAAQAKKAAKRQKQKQRAAAEREAAAAAAAAAAEAEAARKAEQQRQREAQRQQQVEQQQQQQEQAAVAAEAVSSKKKKKKKKIQAGEAAGPAAAVAEQQVCAGSSTQEQEQEQEQTQQQEQQKQQVEGVQQAEVAQQAATQSPDVQLLEPTVHTPEAVVGLGPVAGAATTAAAAAAVGSHAQEPEEELQDLLAHLLPGVYTSSAGSTAVATPDVPPLAAAPAPTPPPQPPPEWVERPQQEGQEQQEKQSERSSVQQQEQQQRDWQRFPAQLRAVLSCPLTGGVLADPVILSDGHSYERHAAEAWLASNSCSPLTCEALDTSVCRPNHALRQLIEEVAGHA